MSVQILMIASNPQAAAVLDGLLAPARMQVRRLVGVPPDLRDLFTDPPQLVIIDITAARRDDPPFDFLQELHRNPEADGIPRIAWGKDLDSAARVMALRAGAHEVFDQTTPQSYVLARLRNLLRARLATDDLGLEGETVRLLARADRGRSLIPAGRTAIMSGRKGALPPALGALLTRLPAPAQIDAPAKPPLTGLAEESAAFIPAPSQISPPAPQRADSPIDLCVIDFIPPQVEGTGPTALGRLLADLRARSATRAAKLLVILPAGLPEAPALAELALDLGVDDLVTDMVGEEELGLRVRSLLHSKAQADLQRNRVTTSITAALTDPLTGLTNRRIALMMLQNLADRRAERGEVYTVALLDIDHFKSVNDRFGHAVGDVVLVAVARLLRANLRAGDIVARFGGEEFLIALPQTGLADALSVLERLRLLMAETTIPLPKGEAEGSLTVTFSAGLAEGPPRDPAQEDFTPLWRAADRALYLAKGAGRNRIHCASPAIEDGTACPPVAI